MKDKYAPLKFRKELCFEKIKPKYAEVIKAFQTYQDDLRAYLVDDALKSQDLNISNTFLVFDKNDLMKSARKNKDIPPLLGYITVLADSIRLDRDLKDTFLLKGIQYKSLPALKIGRLCVDDRYLKKGLGAAMLVWAVNRAAHLNDNIACRFITLDAKRHADRDRDSYHFYKKFGYQILKLKENTSADIAKQKTGCTPMYFDLYNIIRTIRQQ